jgi:hypothetical protein
MTHRGGRALAVGVGVGLALCASVAQAQPPRSPAVIRQQIETSLMLQHETLAALDDPERALRLVWDAYVQMRAAHSSMTINASNTAFPDPLFPFANQRIEQARNNILGAHDALRSRDRWTGQGPWQDVVRQRLTESVRLTQIILATTF